MNATLGSNLHSQVAGIGGYAGAFTTCLIGAYFAYIGYAASTFVAGEIKEANKALPKTLAIASGLIIALYVSISLVGAYALKGIGQATVGNNTYSFLTAWSYLSYGGKVSLASVRLPTVKLWTTTVAVLAASGISLGSA